MPRLSEHGNVGMGIAGTPGSVNQVLIHDALGIYFLTDKDVIFQQISDGTLWTLDLTNGQRVQVATTGANDLAAGGNRWAAWLAGRGLFSSVGLESAAGGLLDVGPDGSIAYTPNRQVGKPVMVWDGFESYMLTNTFAFDLQLLGGDKAIWVDELGIIHTAGLPNCIQISQAWRPRAVQFLNEWWVCYWSNLMGVVLHPFNSSNGYIIVPLGQNAFNHNMMISDAIDFRVIWSTTQGERPEDFRQSFISSLSPRVPLDVESVIDVPAINKPCWLGWFEFGLIPEGTPLAPGNSSLVVIAGGKIIDKNGSQFAQWVQRNPDEPDDVSVIEQKCASIQIPCVAYWDARNWPRWPILKDNDWLCINAYCGVDEIPAQLEARLFETIKSVPAQYKKICLICQCYTSNVTQTENLIGIVPVYAKTAKKFSHINMLLVFSDLGRPTGLNDHPEVRPYWEELFKGITGTPGENMDEPGVVDGVLVDPRTYHFHLVRELQLDGTPETLDKHLNFIKSKWFKFGFGMQHNSSCAARPRLYFPTSICPNAAPDPNNPSEMCLGVKQDTKCWEANGRFAGITNHPPTEWTWDEHGGPAYQPIPANNNPEPSDIEITIFSVTNPTRRSDPLGCHITFEVGSNRPITMVSFELENSGMEPKVIEFPVFPGNDGRFFRGLNVKLTHEGTFKLRLTAENDLGNSNSLLGPEIIVIP